MNTSIYRRGWCLCPTPCPITSIDLQEIANRNDAARHIIAGFSTAMPTLADIWRHLETALDDTPPCPPRSRGLPPNCADTRLDRANLLAAARAILSAISTENPTRCPICATN